MASSQNLNFSDFPDSLDIPNSNWNDADDAPQSRRHTKVGTLILEWFIIKNPLQSQNDFIREWLPWQAEYLNVILEGEELAKGGICEQCEEAEGSGACPALAMGGIPALVIGQILIQRSQLCNWGGASQSQGADELWRDLKHRKWFGFGHDTEQDPGDGGLALFCPGLPPNQVLNLPADYGNFTAQQYENEQPELDVALVRWKRSLDSKERSHAATHRAIMLQTSTSPTSGPLALVPLPVHVMVVLYPTLWWIFRKGRALEITPAVGKFHLAAHKLSCFPRAEADRGEALDIYLLKGDKAPTFHEVQLQLTKNQEFPPGNVGSVAWLAEGISIEDSQDQLRSEFWQVPIPMSPKQEVKISEKRQRLSVRIEKFHSNGQAFFKGLDIDGALTPQDDPTFCGKEEDEDEDREFWDDDEGNWEVAKEEVVELASELMSIWMPSSIAAAKLMELGLQDLLTEERDLRIGQANDCLDQLRTDLGNKAMLYQLNFWTANSTREGTRTKKEIQKVVSRVNKYVRSYQRARQAILQLNTGGNMAERYHEIQPEDLAVSKEVTEESRSGQGTSKWFWMMNGEQSQLNGGAGGFMEEFYRINWLKARARRDRWKEVSLVRHEMLWTGLWFEYHKNMWEKRALQSTEPGKQAYANKQMGVVE
ncbi:hypothetical protein EDC04DRAFT_2615392 [Pisolithus marmoratus]|nr:hypothetical protein EDC04DRAFT_2615392 [Pisolithus marmoratus]